MAFYDQTGGLSGLPIKQERVFSIASSEVRVDTNTPPRKLQRVVRIESFPVDNHMYSFTRGNFEEAPYDFERILKAYQTDSIVKMAMAKYHELIWKNGFELVSENPEARTYLQQRLDIMEVFMGKSFEQLLQEVADSLVLFHNAFLVKARNDLEEYVTGIRARPQFDNSMPIVGFYQLPTHMIRIKRDKHNRVLSYQQATNKFSTGKNAPTWTASRVAHFAIDVKPGTIFGEPFVENVLEDLLALRQVEEDILNLTHRELFPLMIYKVGTDESRAEDGEVDAVRHELENMRTDAGLVIPWRHDIKFEGGQGKALDAYEYLKYFRQRVIVGLGLSEMHLGIMDVANRSVQERLDISLYDRVKSFQRYLSRAMQPIFNELLLEGGFNPYETPLNEGRSDRVTIIFNEIDVETQVKRENNAVFKWVSNAVTHEEMRRELSRDPLEPEEEKRLYFNLIEAPLAVMGRAQPPSESTPKGAAQNSSPNQKKPSTTGALSRNQPQNQHGTRTSPRIKHGLLLPSSVEEDASIDDVIANHADSVSQNQDVEALRPVLSAWLLSQAEKGMMRGATASGELVVPPISWRDESRRAISSRLNRGLMNLQQTLDGGMVLEAVALDAFTSEMSGLGERVKQAAELYTIMYNTREDICLETDSPACGICSRIINEMIDKSFITFERVLSLVHLPCKLSVKVLEEEE